MPDQILSFHQVTYDPVADGTAQAEDGPLPRPVPRRSEQRINSGSESEP
jgi:hypothetical protein